MRLGAVTFDELQERWNQRTTVPASQEYKDALKDLLEKAFKQVRDEALKECIKIAQAVMAPHYMSEGTAMAIMAEIEMRRKRPLAELCIVHDSITYQLPLVGEPGEFKVAAAPTCHHSARDWYMDARNNRVGCHGCDTVDRLKKG